MRGIIIDASEAPVELLAKLEHIMIVQKVAAALPNTLYLFSAFDEQGEEGCVACKIINYMKGTDVDKYILPDNMDLSPEVMIEQFARMGSDAPIYIQHLAEKDRPDLQEEALAYCLQKPEGSPERVIAEGIMAFKRLACPNPEHQIADKEGKTVVPGDPSVTN